MSDQNSTFNTCKFYSIIADTMPSCGMLMSWHSAGLEVKLNVKWNTFPTFLPIVVVNLSMRLHRPRLITPDFSLMHPWNRSWQSFEIKCKRLHRDFWSYFQLQWSPSPNHYKVYEIHSIAVIFVITATAFEFVWISSSSKLWGMIPRRSWIYCTF